MNSTFPTPMPLPLSESLGEGRLNNLKARSVKPSTDNEALRKVSQEFESLFLDMVLKSMRSTVPKSDLLNSYAEETFQEMMDEEIAKESSKSQGMGLSEIIYDQLSMKRIPAIR